jgi:hypothetical protein
MPVIRISYSPDLSLIGTTREVSDEEASVLINDGRAVLVEDEASLTGLSKAELLERAEEAGAEVSERDSKAAIVEAIQARESSGEAGEG